MSTLIKTCGLFRAEDIEAVNEARPDFAGFIVNFPKSHRSVTPEQVKEFRKQLRMDIETVGVFVNEDPEVIEDLVDECAISIVQLHGQEDEAYLRNLRQICDTPIIQAFTVSSPEDVERALQSSAEVILLDSGQGSGKQFDWSLLQGIQRPFMLAGGLTPETIPEAIAAVHPWAIDISSGIETDKLKDPEKIKAAVKAARVIKKKGRNRD